MDSITLLVGGGIVGYGVYSGIVRVKRPEKFHKLEAMKNQWGHRAGLAIHLIAYTLMPIFFGSLVLYLGVLGWSLADLFAQ